MYLFVQILDCVKLKHFVSLLKFVLFSVYVCKHGMCLQWSFVFRPCCLQNSQYLYSTMKPLELKRSVALMIHTYEYIVDNVDYTAQFIYYLTIRVIAYANKRIIL